MTNHLHRSHSDNEFDLHNKTAQLTADTYPDFLPNYLFLGNVLYSYFNVQLLCT
jgi:hypothetical protein